MIAFGCSIGDAETYRACAEPGIRRCAEPGAEVYAYSPLGNSLPRTYNLVLDEAARRDDLEALVLLDCGTELDDRELGSKIRRALADPDVAIAGCAGGSGVHSIAWWEGSVSAAPVVHRYHDHGGGDLPHLSWTERRPPGAEVDAVADFLLVLSPWAVRNLRFDENLTLGGGYGYDFDYCLQARAAGRKVITTDVRVIHHHPLELIDELGLWIEAHIRLAEKWEGRIPGVMDNGADWRERARRAEAEREAARAVAYGYALGIDARVLELERAIEQATSSLSWRATAPLRRANQLRARARSQLRARRGRG